MTTTSSATAPFTITFGTLEWEAASAAAEEATAALRRVARVFRNQPHKVAGIEGRYYVRGGLDPNYADQETRDALAAMLLHGTDPDTADLTPANRAVVAAAFLRGWAVHRPQRVLVSDPRPVWHRDFHGTRVYVGVPA